MLLANTLRDQTCKSPPHHQRSHDELTTIFHSGFLISYSLTMPISSILHASVNLGLHLKKRLNPIYALVSAVIFCVAWFIVVGYWTQCDLPEMAYMSGWGRCSTMIATNSYGGFSDIVPRTKVVFGYWVSLL